MPPLDARPGSADRTDAAPGRREVLVVEIAGERHGFLATEVEMVAEAVTITPLRAPQASIEGLITYRAEHLPVVSLRSRVGLPAKAVEHTDHLVILAARGQRLAVRVDRAATLEYFEVRLLDGDARAGLAGSAVTVVAGTAEGPLFIHDLATLLAPSAPIVGELP